MIKFIGMEEAIANVHCGGVRRAIGIALDTAEEYKAYGGAYTLGELIHNTAAVERLRERGVTPVKTAEEYLALCPDKNVPLVIRSHGVPDSIIQELITLGIPYRNATCPFVQKIHDIAAEKAVSNQVYICGDREHPEVVGIVGSVCDKYAANVHVINEQELSKIHEQSDIPAVLAAQTTISLKFWNFCKKIFKKHFTNAEIFDTICIATIQKQEYAEKLAKECDAVIVVGDSHSSNSVKLRDICAGYAPTLFVSDAVLLRRDFHGFVSGFKQTDCICIGVIAGASTPLHILKEIQRFMSEVKKGNNFSGHYDGETEVELTEQEKAEQLEFMNAIDKDFKRIFIGKRVKAHVDEVNESEAIVNIGTKHAGYIPANELSDNPHLAPEEVVKPGDEIDCVVTSINDVDGIVYLSKRKVDSAEGFEKCVKAAETGEVLEGVVASVVNGGIIAVCEGSRVFIPASQSGVPKSGKLEELKGQKIGFKVIEVNENRNRVVGSIRLARKEANDAVREKFWLDIEVGQKFTGEVKSMESYGVFVDLGGVDGMVHLSELSWSRVRHPRDVVSIGDKLNVYVKGFDKEKRRVSLGAKDPDDNPWTRFASDFAIGDIVKAQIVNLTPFGAFAQVIPGIDGLIHISQISTKRVTNVPQVLSIGQIVDAKITEIDPEKNRVSMSMKAAVEEGGGKYKDILDDEDEEVPDENDTAEE